MTNDDDDDDCDDNINDMMIIFWLGDAVTVSNAPYKMYRLRLVDILSGK